MVVFEYGMTYTPCYQAKGIKCPATLSGGTDLAQAQPVPIRVRLDALHAG